jgi:serine O-acetyltransferase
MSEQPRDLGLTQDYDAHVLFTFARIPASPRLANMQARTARWLTIAFAESWLAIWLYRMKMRLRARKLPLLPGACDLLSRALFKVQIGNDVYVGPGLMITHGQVVIDGRTTIGARCQINPWVTIGLSNSKKLGFSIEGPRIGDNVHIGTGAKIIGPITIGDRVRIGANAVVVHDVPSGVTVVGVPARVVGAPPAPDARRDQLDAMRNLIAEYRARDRSLRSMVDGLLRMLDTHGDALATEDRMVREDLIFLDAVAATGGEESRQVEAAVEAIDAALAPEPAYGRAMK